MVIFFAIIILAIQTCIVYDTYPLMEHLITNEQGLQLIGNSVAKFTEIDDKAQNLINLNPTNPLGSAYTGAVNISADRTGSNKDDTDMLTAVNKATGKTYTTFTDLPGYNPSKNQYLMNTFNKDEVKKIMTNVGDTYLKTLDTIIDDTKPITRP